ncbi:MAG: 5-methylcytosine-specific restriction endonuclease system specificity protein McrC [Desulfovibrio sp.]|nr:5-methylcytosine-specific restriction endonuclease system specificity protein McrC [Desulfovibrio sp.]
MIRPANIYYMLAYAFRVLDEQDEPRPLGSERFENAADLCAAILAEGLKKQVRQGIRKGYVPQAAPLAALRGRLDFTASLKAGDMFARRLVCAYDEFLPDIRLNRILKTTLVWLMKAPLPRERKAGLAAFLPYFREVRAIDPHAIDWRIQYDRNTRSYRLLMYICALVLKGLLQRREDGSVTVREYLDGQAMHELYERFVRAYYRRHFPEADARKSCIAWALDDGCGAMLPQMETDVQLTYRDKILLIDTKYYENDRLERYGTEKLRSQHLYQIFCYVKNKARDAGAGQEVAGLLLYALTDGGALSQSYHMSGNRIGVRTLDLGAEFSGIREGLDAIARDFLGYGRPA